MTQSNINEIANGMSKPEVESLYDILCLGYKFDIVGNNQLKVSALDEENLVDDHMRGIILRFKREFIALTQSMDI
jgi:hypothetical protein